MTLTAFARCNGCEAGIDEGFQEKLDRLVEEGTQVVHLGKCTDRKDTGPCPVIAQARRLFDGQGNPGSYTGLTDRKYATYKMPLGRAVWINALPSRRFLQHNLSSQSGVVA